MYAFISGKVTLLTPAMVVLENNGIGYEIHISLHTYASIQGKKECRLFIHFHVKEDAHTLYGFFSEDEKTLFRLLISVSGVGPASARLVLSSMQPAEFAEAILHEDEAKIRSIKGIGPKSAKRLILELKDKLPQMKASEEIMAPGASNTLKEEALSALIMLGFSKSQAEKSIEKTLRHQPALDSVELLIKETLKNI